MIAALLSAAGVFTLAPIQEAAFQRALELTSEGRFAAALETAEDPSLDPTARSQARFWALYNAGLLDLAQAEALAALQVAPEDAWLLARATELALGLHDPSAAEQHLQAWRVDAEGESSERRAVRAQVEAAVATDRKRSRGLRLARMTTLGLLSACAGALGWLLRSSR